MGQGEELILPHLGILVTTYCNLNCRNCADLIPKRCSRHYLPEEWKEDMRRLLTAVSYIEEVLIIGGEVFLYPWLEEILDFCGKQEKIGKLILTTNGTVEPAERLVTCMERNNVQIRVSGYSKTVAPKRETVIEKCRESGVEVESLEHQDWADIGPACRRNRTEEELTNVFCTCMMKDCVCMQSEGKIFYCSRSMGAYETDIYPVPREGEYVDVRNETHLAERLRKFYELRYISTCDYCDGISCATRQVVPAGIQILDKNIFLELLGIVSVWLTDGRTDMDMMRLLKEILMENRESLADMPEYLQCLVALQEAFVSDTDESRNAFMEQLRGLVNVLTEDYEYDVDETLPYAKTGQGKARRNRITVGTVNGPGTEELLIGEEELYGELSAVYPIDKIIYMRLFVESRLKKLTRQQADCAVCGLSYTQYGIIEGRMAVNTVNLSVPGQDIPYSILMAKKALELAPGLKTIIIPIAWYQGFYDLSSDDAPLHLAVMEAVNIPVLREKRNYTGDCKEGYHKREGSLKLYDKICNLEKLREKRDDMWRVRLGSREFFNEFYPEPPYGGLKFDFKELSEEERWEGAKITAELNERIVTENGYHEVMRYLEEFLPEMRIRGKQVIFFVPPMTKYLYAAYSEPLKRAFEERIVPVLKSFENVRMLDLSGDERFCDDDFLDYEHLGRSGAIKLTAILSDMIQER